MLGGRGSGRPWLVVLGVLLSRTGVRFTDTQRTRLEHVLAPCPDLTVAAEHVRAFTQPLTEHHGEKLRRWIEKVRADDLPALHSFTEGLLIDYGAVVTGLALPKRQNSISVLRMNKEVRSIT